VVAAQFADVRWPAPDALCETLAARMESFIDHSTIAGNAVGWRCLGNVNDVFDLICGAGSAKWRTPRADQAADVARALRGIADKATVPPRGTVCLWDATATNDDGHIAYSDGKGNTVNNWASTIVQVTALSRQQSGYVGWVHPSQLGAYPPHLKTPNPGCTGPTGNVSTITTSSGSAGSDDEPREPLPQPPSMRAGSGRSLLRLDAETFTLTGKTFTAGLTGAVTSIGLDLAPEQVAQLTLTVTDPALQLADVDMRGAVLGWDDTDWDLSAVRLAAAATAHTLAARSKLARRMRRTYRVVGSHKTTPGQWITRWVTGLGGRAIVEASTARAVLPESTDQSLWDAMSGLCSDLGWSFVEYGGLVRAGSRWWAAHNPDLTVTWPLTWREDPVTDLLDADLALSSDDPDNTGTATVQLRRDQVLRIRPWHLARLTGLGIYDGTWLIETVQIPDDPTEPAGVTMAKPRKTAQTSTSPVSGSEPGAEGSEPKDGKSPAWAKWHARRQLAKHGWGTDQWDPLEKLWDRESGWRWNADNPTSDAYGIPQALPGSKMAAAGADWRTNPATQIAWGLGYIKGRYRTPARAWAHSEQNGWY
jgi:hypothetical protein